MNTAKRILAETFRFLDDALRGLAEIEQDLNETLQLQKKVVRQLATLTLTVDLGSPKSSPKIDQGTSERIKIPNIDKLRKNYDIVQSLWETRASLELMESKIQMSFKGKDVDVDKAINQLQKLKKRTELGLNEAFAFLKGLAEKNLPEKLEKTNAATCALLEKSVHYEEANCYSYVYEIDGDLTFSTYIHMKRVLDDDGTYYSDLFVVNSYRTSATSGSEMYVGVLTAFEPPSDTLLMKKVSTLKDIVKGLNILLAMDNFATSIGSLPISTILKTPIDRSLFLYQDHILSIKVDESEVIFTLKPTVQDKAIVDKVVKQLFDEFKALIHNRKNNSRIRLATRKAAKTWIITVYFTTTGDTLSVRPEDLSFLKDKFALNDSTLNQIVRTINAGSPV